MKSIYILQGTNEGDREVLLNDSLRVIEAEIGRVIQVSGIYESEPWGFESQQRFLNRVVLVNTVADPLVVLERLMRIEHSFGRVRHDDGLYHSRTLDLDILLIDQMVISLPHLVVPHPRLQERMFTLLPLCEIAPEYIHPMFSKTIRELVFQCEDPGKVMEYHSEG